MKIIKNILTIIGFICILTISGKILFKTVLNDQSADIEGRCINDGTVIRLDSYYDKHSDFHYELIAYTTGFSDKVTFVKLLKGRHIASSFNCIEKEKVTLIQDIYLGPEHESDVQWPKAIIVNNNKIDITYTNKKNESDHLSNITVTWNIN